MSTTPKFLLLKHLSALNVYLCEKKQTVEQRCATTIQQGYIFSRHEIITKLERMRVLSLQMRSLGLRECTATVTVVDPGFATLAGLSRLCAHITSQDRIS